MSPAGIPRSVEESVRTRAGHRCGYCRSLQRYVFAPLEIEHIIPRARGGGDDEENLWLACRMCNGFKGAQVAARDPTTGRRTMLFNPSRQRWSRHFTWSDNALEILGHTACGRATVAALRLNNAVAVLVRHEWVAAGWHPPRA